MAKGKPDKKPPSDGTSARARGKPVGAVIAAVRILEALHHAQKPLRSSAVAQATGLYRGTTFNILRTLHQQGLVAFEEEQQTYHIGTRLLEFAHGVLRTSGLMESVRPEMFSLAERCGTTVFLASVSDDYDLVLLDFVGTGFRTDAYFSVGRRSPRFSGAPGVIMAAFSGASMEYVNSCYDATEWFRRPTFAEFARRVRDARKLGYAVDRGDRRSGLSQVAVPVFSHSGKLALVITAVAFSYEMSEAKIKKVARLAGACADRIASGLHKLRLE
jgi:DNA-binding IclR family transcriptional regulator